jgi:hypothetical protein
MASIDDRLTSAEKAINRILEILQDSPTVEEASEHIAILDSNTESTLYRITSLENKITSLKYIWQQAYNRVNS